MSIAVFPVIKGFVGVRSAGEYRNVTSGSLSDLSDDLPGTVNWQFWTEIPPGLHGEYIDYNITVTGTVSGYELLGRGPTADYVQVDYEMLQLEIAAEVGNEQNFLTAQKAINWQRRTPDDFIYAIQLALRVGAYLAARILSNEGAKQHPQHNGLRKYADILAPPKVTKSDRPPDPTLKANRDWLMAHTETFKGLWVALRNGELLGSATSLELLVAQLDNTKDTLLTRVF